MRVGANPVGAIFYLQNDCWWRDRYRGPGVCRDRWIVEAFLNGTMGASRRNRDTGVWENSYHVGCSDMAVVRSLRHGHRQQVAVRMLQLLEEYGPAWQPTDYPSLPDLRLYGVSPSARARPA